MLCSSGVKQPENDTEQSIVLCDIGNPLPHYRSVDFSLKLSPSHINGSQFELLFIVEANRLLIPNNKQNIFLDKMGTNNRMQQNILN